MVTEPTHKPYPQRTRIIDRPRLTHLLDDTTARIILLIAPAGYGKTILARQWVAGDQRRAAWYHAAQASGDVAALAVGLADAIRPLVPGVGRSIKRRLTSTDDPEREVVALAEFLAADVVDWPLDACLVLDDYQLTMSSPACTRFLDALIRESNMRLLVSSRVRPEWATARRLAYGELYEVDRNTMAMTDEEAALLLQPIDDDNLSRLCGIAAGWPAVLGLAARSQKSEFRPTAVAMQLHDFFADELFRAMSTRSQQGLIKLSLAPYITDDVLNLTMLQGHEELVREASNAGFLITHERDRFELHPLLRAFLRTKLKSLNSGEINHFANALIKLLVDNRRWDDAQSVLELVPSREGFLLLLRESLGPLLTIGRIVTLRRWLAFGYASGLTAPELDLVEAEVALRGGEIARAAFFARRAARRTPPSSIQRSYAFRISGLGAHLTDDFDAALGYYDEARKTARTPEDLREALWGLFITSTHLELDSSTDIQQAFEELLSEDDADDILRAACATFHTANLNHDPLQTALGNLAHARTVLSLASNPHVMCRFVLTHAHCSMLVGLYDDAIRLADEAAEMVTELGLHFADVYCVTTKAFALAGLGRTAQARELVHAITRDASAQGDVHTMLNGRVILARALLAEGKAAEAALVLTDLPHQVTEFQRRLPSPSVRGELVATRALAYASAGELVLARQAATEARTISRALETATFTKMTTVISTLILEDDDAERSILDAIHHVESTNHIDGLIVACRAFPKLLAHLPAARGASTLTDGAAARHAHRLLAHPAASRVSHDASVSLLEILTPRETEVYQLLAKGYSNLEIAERLVISLSTVKVHVRHIFDKLGVRSRTQAAIRAVLDYAAPTNAG